MPVEDYEYLIVMLDSPSDAFVPFRDFQTRRGLRARIISAEDIEGAFTGTDTGERIRNAIFR